MKKNNVIVESITGAKYSVDTKLNALTSIRIKSNKLEELKKVTFILK